MSSLDLARLSAPTSQLTDLSHWAVRSFSVTGALSGISPKRPSEISETVPLTSLSLERELAWARGILSYNFEPLQRHVQLRAEIERELLKDNKERALELVDEMEASVCWSLELLAFKIALLNDVKGLEAQKNWIAANTNQTKSITARFFGHWFGVRAERFSNPEGYLQEIERKIPSMARNDIGLPYLYYQLTGLVVKEVDQAAVLSHHNLHSFVDQYECCVHLAKEASIGQWQSSAVWYHHFLPIMKQLGDPRHLKIASLFGDADSIAKLPVREPLFRVRAPEAIDELESSGSLDDLFDAALGLSLTGRDENLSTKKIWNMLRKFHQSGRNHTEALNELHKMSLLYPRTAMGEWCECIRKQDFRRALSGVDEYELRKYFTSEQLGPDTISSIHEPIRKAYADRITSQIKDAAAIEYVSLSNGLDERDIDDAILDDPFLADAALTRSINSSNLARAGYVAKNIRSRRGITTKRALQVEIESLLSVDAINDAIDLIANSYRADPSIVGWIPWPQIAARLDDATVDDLAGNLNTALVCWLLADRYDQSFHSSHSYAIEGYLISAGVEKPSQIPLENVKRSVELQQFLYQQCTFEPLSLSLTYEGPRSLERQRIEILQLLRLANEERGPEYDEEIAHILRAQEVSKAIATLQKSKISMDEEPLMEWAQDNLRSKFERYRDYVRIGLLPVGEDFLDHILSILGQELDTKNPYAVPDDEAAALFIDIVTELAREFSLNPKHGLNAYLSLRIRHGTISGQLRRPCQEQNMLTMVEAEGDDYPPSKHWFTVLSDEVGAKSAGDIAMCFAKFSRSYDEEISSFANEYVQVLRPEMPNGLFRYRMSNDTILGLAFDTLEIEEFDEFLAAFLKLYWIHMAQVLEEVRRHVRDVLALKLMGLVDELEEEANSCISPVPATLRDALLRARGSLKDAVDELELWFNVPQVVESAPLQVIDLAEVGKEMVCQIHPDFKPQMVVHDETKTKLVGALTLFTDVFYLLIGNIEKHSGLRVPQIDVFVSHADDGLLEILVESDCKDIARHQGAVNLATEKLQKGNYELDVSREGGSGFYKLAKLTAASKGANKLEISIDNKRSKFQVMLRFTFTPLGEEKETLQHATVVG